MIALALIATVPLAAFWTYWITARHVSRGRWLR